MKKIFDHEFRRELYLMLLEAGIEDEQAVSFIRTRYKTALKEAVIGRLKSIITSIEMDKIQKVEELVTTPETSDIEICDINYISFGDITDCKDIGDVIYELKEKE